MQGPQDPQDQFPQLSIDELKALKLDPIIAGANCHAGTSKGSERHGGS